MVHLSCDVSTGKALNRICKCTRWGCVHNNIQPRLEFVRILTEADGSVAAGQVTIADLLQPSVILWLLSYLPVPWQGPMSENTHGVANIYVKRYADYTS